MSIRFPFQLLSASVTFCVGLFLHLFRRAHEQFAHGYMRRLRQGVQDAGCHIGRIQNPHRMEPRSHRLPRWFMRDVVGNLGVYHTRFDHRYPHLVRQGLLPQRL